ncbi:MAG: hypothetical protein ACRERV_13530 [Methylococcales bacterium]
MATTPPQVGRSSSLFRNVVRGDQQVLSGPEIPGEWSIGSDPLD